MGNVMIIRNILKLSALILLVPTLVLAETDSCSITSTDSEINIFQKFTEGTDFECQADGSLKAITPSLASCERKDYYPLIAFCISSQLNLCSDHAFSLESNLFELNSELSALKGASTNRKLIEENRALKRKLKKLQNRLKTLKN
jgi:hypothetical protein